ncbi:hypothetical protein F4820DRAFT_413373 [Hypoxylon rubiginosum]|uniref:Uncharacterized protein n=1 Tax=Hypoxylon rubiginosum TaxID=110542 RepID=A0ACB9Z7Y3_9PEZI|nr:hypothetical protein F4820DRAFT_413373 [Hypoxylon rubiginosum]
MNITSISPEDDAHLLRCWRIQDCKGCLAQVDCSWCPFSWTCVPNSNRVPFLAPAWDENVCPHWAERWEIRTRPLGCQVSTITTLTSLVTIASTLVFVLLVTLAVFGIRRLNAYTKKNPTWWKIWTYRWTGWPSKWQGWIRTRAGSQNGPNGQEPSNEQEPLLPS